MKFSIVLLICFFGSRANSISSLSFIKGRNSDFNKVFVSKFVASAIDSFSLKGKPSVEFDAELETFLREESFSLYFEGEAERTQRTKFGLKFIVERDEVKQVLLTLFSSKKVLSTWDLSNFKRAYANHSKVSKTLPESCKALKVDVKTLDYYSQNLETGDCKGFLTEATFAHPLFKGLVHAHGKSEVAPQPIVKKLVPGMTSVPRVVRAFSQKWRLPPSRFFNYQKTNELYLP